MPNRIGMELTAAERLLVSKGVKPTANRILVVRTLMGLHSPATLASLEEMMVTMDRSSIFRALSLFEAHDIVHTFEDGKGTVNYELCRNEGECDRSDAHAHFYCEHCHRSFCLDTLPSPFLSLPEGFKLHSISFVVKGLCPECAKETE